MAYVQPNGKVKVRAFSRPVPRYDFEPMFLTEPDEVGMRRQLAHLVSQAICMADDSGLDMENGDIPDEWRIDWGQKVASGTCEEEVTKLVADIPAPYVEKILLRAFYRSIMEIIGIGGDTLTSLMGVHALEGIVADPMAQLDGIQLSFAKGGPDS